MAVASLKFARTGFVACLLATVLLGWGTGAMRKDPDQVLHVQDGDKAKSGVVTIAPSVFTRDEDLKRLLPHIGLTGPDAVCMTTKDSATKFTYELFEEEWKDGKVVKRKPGMSTSRRFERLSFSIRELDSELSEPTDEPRVVRTWVVEGIASFRGVVKVPRLAAIGFPQVKTLPTMVQLELNEEVPIWAYARGKGTEKSGGESIEDMAKRVEWCLLIKFRISEASKEP